MKRQVSITEFKAALKRNDSNTCSLVYTQYGYYLITKKCEFYFRANTFIEKKVISDLSRSLGYSLCSMEEFLNG